MVLLITMFYEIPMEIHLISNDAIAMRSASSPSDLSSCENHLTFVIRDPGVLRKPTFSRLTDLYENYQPDVSVTEDRTREEKREEDALLNEMMKTKVMKETFDFLKENGLFTKSKAEFEHLLSELWFSVYSRGKRIKGSSGFEQIYIKYIPNIYLTISKKRFEHVFLGEKKNGAVQGFHNWLYFNHLEQMGQVDSMMLKTMTTRLEQWSIFCGNGMVMVIFSQRWNGDGF